MLVSVVPVRALSPVDRRLSRLTRSLRCPWDAVMLVIFWWIPRRRLSRPLQEQLRALCGLLV